jgi:hypothetical protein
VAYTTWDNVQNRARMLLKDENEESLAPFISAAEAWADNRLRTVYKMPLTTVDPILAEIVAAEAAALAIADAFSNRGRDEVTLAGDLHRWAQETLDYCINNTTLTAELIPRPTAEARPMVATNTPAPSSMNQLLDQAFAYRGGPGWPRR